MADSEDELSPDLAPHEHESAAQLAEDAERSARRLGSGRLALGMAAVLAVTVLLRMLNLTFPMGQPAGMAAHVGRRWMHGEGPYRDNWDHQGPALYLMAGIVTDVIGISPAANRLAMMTIDLATLLLLYALVRQWCNRIEGMVAAGIFGFFSGALLVQGDCLAAGPPMNFLIVLAFLALLRSEGRKVPWLALAGLALGLALCFRLAALVYLAGIVFCTVASKRGSDSRVARWGLRPIIIVAFAAAPPAAFAAYFASVKALDDFWNSYVIYNWLYHWPLGHYGFLRHRLATLWGLAREQAALWLFAGGWIIHAFSIGFRRETRFIAFWCLLASTAALAARHVETEHFVLTIPPLAVAAALAVTNPSEKFLRRNEQGRLETSSGMLIAFAITLALGFLYTARRILRDRATSNVMTTDRAAYKVGRLILKNTEPHEKVYQWGSRAQMYVYAQRGSAHRFFYNWPINSPQRVSEFFEPYLQPELFENIYATLTDVMPPFFVTTEDYVEGRLERPPPKPIEDWFRFVRRHYYVAAKFEALPFSYTVFVRNDRKLKK